MPNQTPAGLIQSLSRFGNAGGEGGSSVGATNPTKAGRATFDIEKLNDSFGGGSGGGTQMLSFGGLDGLGPQAGPLRDLGIAGQELVTPAFDPTAGVAERSQRTFNNNYFDPTTMGDLGPGPFQPGPGPLAPVTGLSGMGQSYDFLGGFENQSYDFGSSGLNQGAMLGATTLSADQSALNYGMAGQMTQPVQNNFGNQASSGIGNNLSGIGGGLVSQNQINQNLQSNVANQVQTNTFSFTLFGL